MGETVDRVGLIGISHRLYKPSLPPLLLIQYQMYTVEFITTCKL
jgi:hypothetical protein